jgi:hypothetical protein
MSIAVEILSIREVLCYMFYSLKLSGKVRTPQLLQERLTSTGQPTEDSVGPAIN